MKFDEYKKMVETSNNKLKLLLDENLISEIEDYRNFEFDFLIEKNLNDAEKIDFLSNTTKRYSTFELENFISKMSTTGFLNFLNNNTDYIKENNIQISRILKYTNIKKQIDFVGKINELNVSNIDKKMIILDLKDETKEEVKNVIPQEYKPLLDLEVNVSGSIKLNFDIDLENYRGLDKRLTATPSEYDTFNKNKMKELCEICPDMSIQNLTIGASTTEEYLDAEKWIDEVIEQVDQNWTPIQKLAYIENAVGKKVSYSPDYGTESFDINDSRAIWKIINTGHGVCNGIADLTKYMLKHVAIESEIVSSRKHSFLKIVDFPAPLPDGTNKKVSTIVDPTWDLAANQYGAYPQHFCKSYTEIRKFDIDSNGIDHKSHLKDTLEDADFEIDENVLRSVYTSIGLAREDGKFLFANLCEKSDEIGKMDLSEQEAITKQFDLLKEYNPNYGKTINSNTEFLKILLSNKDNISYNKAVINRVYEKQDTDKKAVQYIYINMPESGDLFYYIDSNQNQILNISKEDFEDKFECYEMDLEKTNGLRPWQNTKLVIQKDLNSSSGEIALEKGDER